jgi:hypothetical protein
MNLPLIVALVGLVVYVLPPPVPGKLTELGRISFFAGLLVYLLGPR